MRRLCTLLGLPQHRFASIHVVGTNGKSSVARMTAALLQAHGVPSGAYLSPHIDTWRERIVVHGEQISAEAFDEAVARAEEAAQIADRSAGEEGPVTQFELLTGAAFHALATAGVKVGVIEAGLGGRLDATNVIPSRATVLTSVGLDHTEWLGETLAEIAAEKLAVLRDHTVLVRGELPAEAGRVAQREAKRHHADILGPAPVDDALAGLLPGFQRANLGLALTATSTLVSPLNPDASARAIRRLSIRGRAQVIEGDPTVILDAAHNADGARALAAALPELTGGRPAVCCLAILEGKDAESIVTALAPHLRAAVCTEIPDDAIASGGRPGGHSRSAAELAGLLAAQEVEAEAEADLEGAVKRALALAAELDAPLLVTGSHFLIGLALGTLGA